MKWIKISSDIFENEKFSVFIESEEDKDNLIVVWFKLLTLAGKQDNNGIFMFKDKPYTPVLFSNLFKRPYDLVKKALDMFVELEMLDFDGSVYSVRNWDVYQSRDAYERKKERDRIYQADRRAKLKKNVESADKSSDTETTVCRKHSISISNNINNINSINTIKDIINYLNKCTGKKFTPNSKETQRHINARLGEGYTKDDFKRVIDIKTAEWKGGMFEKYLRPQTLFTPGHFESYLNESGVSPGEERKEPARPVRGRGVEAQ